MRIPRWHRTHVAAERLRELQDRSDLLGGLQAFGYLGLIAHWHGGRGDRGFLAVVGDARRPVRAWHLLRVPDQCRA